MKFCKKCGIDTIRHKSGKCNICVNANNAAWRERNPEKMKHCRENWLKENSEKSKATASIWIKANPEKRLAAVKKFAANNPEKIRLSNAAHHLKNKEAINARHKKYCLDNPALFCNYSSKRRALKNGREGTLSKGLFAKLFILQRGKCPVCKISLSNVKPRSPMDHIIALSNGGLNEDLNMQILCKPCNSSKHAKDPIKFMQSRGFLL